MNAKTALAMAFLQGKVLNVKTCFTLVGLSNLAREASRCIEQPFGVKLTRTHMKGKSRYGVDIHWFNYRLEYTEENREGIELMKIYVREHRNAEPEKKINLESNVLFS